VEAIAFIHFTAEDVVRHPLVQKIVSAYARHEEIEEQRDGQRREIE
jgi:phosphate starvation-inducible PhoH-like protein